ncbi:MAG: penicillin-insensitive murein endopeptidase [Deltaproteobacteria bacterium]|nr:penicillin-insensitive murein endopeptidase [Deltaproteobacteria bacterium]
MFLPQRTGGDDFGEGWLGTGFFGDQIFDPITVLKQQIISRLTGIDPTASAAWAGELPSAVGPAPLLPIRVRPRKRSRGARWRREVNTQFPREGKGFYSYEPSHRQVGQRETIAAFLEIAEDWADAHPEGPRIGIGRISFEGGGPMEGASHRLGVDVDIRPMRNDSREAGTDWRLPSYSRELTQELVDIIFANPVLEVDVIFFNDPNIKGVRPWSNHDNHLHVRFKRP